MSREYIKEIEKICHKEIRTRGVEVANFNFAVPSGLE